MSICYLPQELVRRWGQAATQETRTLIDRLSGTPRDQSAAVITAILMG
jgi:hypothetical protein